MHMLGKYYRLVIYSGIFISCLVSRYILVEVFSVGLKIKEWKKRNGLMRAQGIPDIQKKGLKLE